MAHGDNATYYNVKKEPEKLVEMLKLTGGIRQVPVIVENGKVTIGYQGGT